MNWFEQLGQAVAQELNIPTGSAIEHQCGTVWVTNDQGETIAISGMKTEDTEEEVA